MLTTLVRTRLLLACLALLALVLPVSATLGCGGADEESAKAEDGTTELTLVTTRPTAPEVWDAAIDSFKEAHPNITVTLETTPNNSSELHALLTQRLGNQDPSVDVFMMDLVWSSEFAMAGYAEPLTERFSFAKRDEYFPATIEAYTVAEEVYAVPFFMDAGVLFYRQDLLDEHGFSAPPQTWPELVEQARTILEEREEEGLHGYVGQFKRYEGLICNMLELLESGGGDVGNPMDPQSLPRIEWIVEELLPLMPEGVFTYEEQHAYDAFRSGNAVFMRNWPYAWEAALTEDSLVQGKVGMAPLPRHLNGSPASTLGGWGFALSAFSEHPEEAWKLIEHMSSHETQRALAKATGKAPANRPSFDHEEVRATNPQFESLRPILEQARPRPKSPIYGQLSDILQRYYTDALRDYEDPNQLVERANQAQQRIREAHERAGLD